MIQPTLYLIRGVPGSGKSTAAKQLAALGYTHVENDQFLMEDGVYKWSDERRKAAVKQCVWHARYNLQAGRDVVVSNCFIRKNSMRPYYAMAKELGARVVVSVMRGNHKSVHNVPDDVIQSMKEKFEE